MTLKSFIKKNIEIQGHRGSPSLLPENTLLSFNAAIEAGVDAIELDLLMTKDEEIVIQHDFFVNSKICTYMDGSPILDKRLIKEMTLAEIKMLDCGRQRCSLFPNKRLVPKTQIPTLKELFELISLSKHPNAKKIRLNLEIKTDPHTPQYVPFYEKLAQKATQVVTDGGFENRVIYSSFDFTLLEEIRKIDLSAPIGLIFEKSTLACQKIDPNNWDASILEWTAKLQANTIFPNYSLLTHQNIHTVQASNVKVIAWTVNQIEIFKKLINQGVDGVITDFPHEMIPLST